MKRYWLRRGGMGAGRRGTALIALAVACCWIAWAGEEPPVVGDIGGYNVIFITIDALRADHVGAYGYHRNTTPFIDGLAKEGLVFDTARSNSSYTRESVSSLFSGRLPTSAGAFGWFAQLPDETPTLAGAFREKGYRTILLSNTIVLAGLTDGFDEVMHLPLPHIENAEGPKLSARAFEVARNSKHRPFFMYLHYFDPHGPYEPPDELYLRFADRIYPHPLHLFDDVREGINQLTREGFGPGDERFEDMVLRYDAEIADSDRAIEMLMLCLKSYGLLEKTLVIITADHGEEFMEHGYVDHAWALYEESLRVPLIFWAPGVVAARRLREPVSWVDLFPTLAALFGLREPSGLDGESLFAAGDRGFDFVPPKKPFIAELMLQERNMVRTVIHGGWKYFAAPKWRTPAERPAEIRRMPLIQTGLQAGTLRQVDIWGPPVHEELYDLEADPGERTNLLAERPEERARMAALLKAYEESCRARGMVTPEVYEMPDITREDLEVLRAIGYF